MKTGNICCVWECHPLLRGEALTQFCFSWAFLLSSFSVSGGNQAVLCSVQQRCWQRCCVWTAVNTVLSYICVTSDFYTVFVSWGCLEIEINYCEGRVYKGSLNPLVICCSWVLPSQALSAVINPSCGPSLVTACTALDRVSRSGEIQWAQSASGAIFSQSLVFWCSKRARNAPFWSSYRTRQMVTFCWYDLRSVNPSTLMKKDRIYSVHVPYVHERPQCLDLEKNELERGHQGQYIC